MNNTATVVLSQKNIKTAVIDFSALLFIYFTPAISHLFSFPIYLLEPMRIMLILSLAHTSKKNAYLIALSLPIFSFLISTHPSIIKSLLITGELAFNVWLFFYLSQKIKNVFGAAAASIIISKIAYYIFKFLLISTALISGSLISTPLLLQLGVTIVLSGYLYFVVAKKQ
jgi:hypothetical protein